jgi:deoxyribodipyrimidine photolyase-related protein
MILIILPNQLFPLKILPDNIDTIYLIEEPRYFTDFDFHKLKLVYHRASMKKYENEVSKKYKCVYKDFNKVNTTLYSSLNKESTYYFNPIDHKLFNKYKKLLSKATMIDNLNFLLTPKEIEDNKNVFYKNNKYSHDLFYKFQRERLDILIKNNKPVGGKWSFDTENRNALPKNITIPKVPKVKKDKYYKEGVEYINKHFEKNYGAIEEWSFPIDNKGAIKWLKNFIKKRLPKFGPYEDAVDVENPFLFHSVLSPMMNIGILPDTIVVKTANEYYEKNKDKIPIASFEGFIRQVIGWRNYVYSVYMLEPKMYEDNYLKHKNKISEKYWLGTTDIKPIDSIINNIVKYCYCHHIERLMYLGNWFLINQVDPKEVHRIFMEWTIDAYDWVMVPNVMGMSQYADGGKMMTRIYFSSSNYIDKMSNFKRKKDEEWWKIWDAIYYSFIHKHYDLLKNNYATSRQTIHWKNKSEKEKDEILKLAKKNIS